jgi:hypothetical protein
MFRRDYILVGIEQFSAVLARIIGLTKQSDWQMAENTIAEELKRLAGVDIAQFEQFSDVELFASLMQGEPGLSVETKVFMIAALLKSSGDVATGEGRLEVGRRRYLKGLHLLLGIFGRSDSVQRPDFAPSVEAFVAALGNESAPSETRVLLMRHYEQAGEFGKAEDELFAILEAEPPGAELMEFGTAFYQRLLARTDAALDAGNLPRAEAEAGIAQLKSIPNRRA